MHLTNFVVTMAIMSTQPTPQRRGTPRDSFSARLVLLRHDLGLSQAQAAKLCGVSQAAWSNWEGGEIPRDQGEMVRRIADATGYRREWLMWGSAGGSPTDPDGAPAVAANGVSDSSEPGRFQVRVPAQERRFTLSPIKIPA